MLKWSVIFWDFFRKEMQTSGLLDLEVGTDKQCRNVGKQLPHNPEERGNQ